MLQTLEAKLQLTCLYVHEGNEVYRMLLELSRRLIVGTLQFRN